MKAMIEGELISIGETTFNNQKYPYFEILQRSEGNGGSQIVRVSGVTMSKIGSKISLPVLVSISDQGKLRVKSLEAKKVPL